MAISIEPVSLCTGLILGTALGYGLLRYVYRSLLNGQENTELQTRLEICNSHNQELQENLNALQNKIDAYTKENTELATLLETEKKAVEEKLTLIEETKAQMRDTFKSLSQDALDNSQKSFLNLATENLKQFQEGAKHDLEKREKSIESLVKPVNQSLESMDTKIKELEKERQNAYGELREHLQHMKDGQDQLRGETASLVQALRSPATRGQWGELQLKRTLEMAGMVEGVHYEQQVSVDTDEGRQRPDVIIRLPGGQNIIVDAKAPIEAYLDSLEREDTAERALQLDRHARHVREHMKQLGSKAYWQQFETPEFVIMFLPGESYFSAALDRDPSLIEAGVDSKVIPASPTTLISMLKAVSYGWKQEKMAESAKEVSELGKELYKRLTVFGEHMTKVGKGLDNAVSNYNKAVGSLERKVLPAARKFDDLELTSGQKDIPELEQIDKNSQDLTAPELTAADKD